MNRLNSMQIFVEVARASGFTAAANKIGLSRAQVSKSVMQLEQHLGTRLFNRTTRRISLTETGQIYLERCIDILQAIDAREDFTRYVFFLFMIMLMGVATIGTSAVSMVYGIKDFIGSYRGLYISKGKGVYLAGAILGAVTIILLIVFIIMLGQAPRYPISNLPALLIPGSFL